LAAPRSYSQHAAGSRNWPFFHGPLTEAKGFSLET
jgi:hypothetical protein